MIIYTNLQKLSFEVYTVFGRLVYTELIAKPEQTLVWLIVERELYVIA